MSKQLATSLAAAALLAGGLTSGCGAAAPTSLADARTHATRPVNFTFVAHRDEFRIHEVGEVGPSIGDGYIEFGQVKQDGARVGTHGGECTIVQAADNRVRYTCLSTVRLPGGQLRLEGLMRVPSGSGSDYRMAITGGTGVYAGAVGDVHVTSSGSQIDRQRFAVDLL